MTMLESKPKRAVCRYHGGKWKLADWIISHFPAHRFYVEPFGGGGSVLMKKPRSRCELYNDLDGEVVNYFRVLRDPLQSVALKSLLELTPYAREELKEAFKPVVDGDPIERVRRFFVRMAMPMGGKMQCATRGFRTRRGLDNSSPATDYANYFQHINSFNRRLQHVVIENRPALEIIKDQDSEDTLFYCDPPYLKGLRNARGRETYLHDMEDGDHIALAETLHELKGFAIISGYPSDLYDHLFTKQGWTLKTHNAFADSGRKTIECLWLSPRTAEALNNSLF